jgi:hypothetical protein
MGLCLSWTFGLAARHDPIAVLDRLRQAALDLPFESVGERTSLEGSACIAPPREERERPRGLSLPARDFVLISCARYVQPDPAQRWSYVAVPPLELHVFRVQPGPRCETALFFLARYPSTHEANGRTIRMPRSTTRSSSYCCKTQYASNHGVDAFLRCHLGLVALLDRARELGLRVGVRDDGGFARTRSVPRLLAALNRWNELVAGLGAALSAHLPEGTRRVGGLTGRADLERLEARGLDRYRELAAFVGRLGGRARRRRGGGPR